MNIDIDAIRKLTDAATPGPWTARTTYPHIVMQNDDETAPSLIATTLAGNVVADAEFVAAARTLVPQLCDEVERRRNERDFARNVAARAHTELAKARTQVDIDALRADCHAFANTAPANCDTADTLADKLARKVPVLLAEIERLSEEREHMELNPTGTAEWLKNRVNELTAELEKVRGQYADTRRHADLLTAELADQQRANTTYANENARLRADLRAANDELLHQDICQAVRAGEGRAR